MKKYILFFFFPIILHASPKSDDELTVLFNSLDPYSISEHFAFYHLYPNSIQGKASLSNAWKLLYCHRNDKNSLPESLIFPSMEIDSIINLVNKQPFDSEVYLDKNSLIVVENISDHLANRKLKGYYVWDKESIAILPEEEIDLARALLLYQFENDRIKIRQYEASLDLIALQILARLPSKATDKEKIRAINQFIFEEKQFRFPPHSLWAKDIDLYTFLPSVLDSRKGVCLGVSILYLSIAQRLDLSLDIITPPGHIFIRYNSEELIQNIETTSRGIHFPDKVYLGINTRKLQERTIKEVIGLAFINQASVAWQKGDHESTIELYNQALPFLNEDPLLKMFLGYNYLFVGNIKEGEKLLKEVRNIQLDYSVSQEVTPGDYLDGYVDVEGIKAIFSYVDENRQSIIKKQKELINILKKYPKFRDGLLHLGITYLQIGRKQEAYHAFNKYHTFDPTNPTIEYYLSIICLNRFMYQKAWQHLKNAQNLTKKRSHQPDCLKGLNQVLKSLYPDPEDKILIKKHTIID